MKHCKCPVGPHGVTEAEGGAEPQEGSCRGCRCLGSTMLRSTEVPASVVRGEETCSELRRSAGTVMAFNLPSCFVPEGTENRWMMQPPGF